MEAPKLNLSDTHPTNPAARRRAALIVFLLIAFTIAVTDQLMKQWVVGHYSPDVPSPIIGDWLRIDYIHNQGGLFGVFQGSALAFAAVTVGVAAVLAGLEISSGWRSWIITITLGLLLGGAIGNFIDRISLGYVVDFADIGIGTWRFYIFNIADSAVTVAILLMLGIWILGPIVGLRVGLDGITGGDDESDASAPEPSPVDGDASAGAVIRERATDEEGR